MEKENKKIVGLELQHEKLSSLNGDPTLFRTFEEQEKILDIKNKAIYFLKETLGDDFNEKLILSNDFSKALLNLGCLLEKENILDKAENAELEYDNIIDLINDEILDLHEKLGINFQQEDKEEVQLSDELIKEEISTQAKREGFVKEKVIDGTIENQNGQIAASLVVDAPQQMIQQTIENISQRMAPKPTPLTRFKKKSKEENKGTLEKKIETFSKEQQKGIVLDTETFSSHISTIPANMVKLNIQAIRNKSLDLSKDRPIAVVEQSGLITERRKLI